MRDRTKGHVCIGGHKDGHKVTVLTPANWFLSPVPNWDVDLSATPELAEYRFEIIQGKNGVFGVWVLKELSIDTAIEMLLEKYSARD